MSAAKKKSADSGQYKACDVLGDYMCPGMPADRPGQVRDKKKDEQAKEP